MSAEVTRDTLQQIAESLRSYLETLKDSGVGSLPGHVVSEQPLPVRPLQEQAPAVSPAVSQPMMKKEEAVAMPAQTQDMFVASHLQGVNTLEALRAEIGDCRRCKLCQGRTNIVFGVGHPQAEVMFVGETKTSKANRSLVGQDSC
jgi:hypothetical protein